MANANVYKYDDMKRSEHMAVRKTAGWYLWTHQLVEVTGKDAAAFLDLLFTKSIANLKVGRERYTTMLNENAIIIDDVVVFRIEEETFWVSTLFPTKLMDWMAAHKNTYEVEWEDITSQYHMYAVQGPESLKLVNGIVETPVDDLPFFSFRENRIGDVDVIVNRAGFTGEKYGYEIYIAPKYCDLLESKLKEVGTTLGAKEVTEFQVMAWTLPTEAGFYYMRNLYNLNPFEAGLEGGISYDKDFIGKDMLLKIKENGATREIVPFVVEEADIFIHGHDLGGIGDPVYLDDEVVGSVLKLNYSYVLEKNFGNILAQKNSLKPGDRVRIRNHEGIITEKITL